MLMRTLYFDCFAGASGDMILGALVSLGIDRGELIERLRLLDIADFDLEYSVVDRSGISAVHVDVKVPHEHVHRHLRDIEAIIGRSRLPDSVKARAIAVFTRLAEAEAGVHGIDVQKVHFHEVGAMDAIIDVVGACICFEMLGVERFVASKIHVGSGFVTMAHGKYPVPPPAVAALLKNIPTYSTEIEGELITPTGAAIILTVCDSYGPMPEMLVEHISYGAGTRSYKDFPSVLRLMLGESSAAESTNAAGERSEQLMLIETNIDDLAPQILGLVMEKAFESGALDCWFTPIQMKKNRPATLLSILCDPSKADGLKELLYRETTTIGVRLQRIDRECLPRENVRVSTEFGEVDVKIAVFKGTAVNIMPEFEQVKRLAAEQNAAFKAVWDAALAAGKGKAGAANAAAQ